MVVLFPQVDNLFASAIHATRSTQLSSVGKILEERVLHGLEALADVSLDLCACDNQRSDPSASYRDGDARGAPPPPVLDALANSEAMGKENEGDCLYA